MTPFLEQVARHYFAQSERDYCFVFPNRRSMLFFDKYYSGLVKQAGTPEFKPAMLTINDFFYKVCKKTATDRIDLLLCLYECYSECRKETDPEAVIEPLDDFIFWGEMILADFNDVDKYCVDAKSIFTNVSEFKSMQDLSIFNEKQRQALEVFMGNFSPLTEDKKYKLAFRKTWDLLYPIYEKFNARLLSQGKAYDGMVYKQLVDISKKDYFFNILEETFPEVHKFVFIGLNAPSESEKTVLRKLRNAGRAEFCWDYSSDWIKDKNNRSSFFLDQNISDFGQAFKIDPEGLGKPEINVLSVPSTVGQCKQLNKIFRHIGGKIDINTAIVLPDENLLIPTLNSLPEDIEKVNVTMGYPMSGSLINSFVEDICALQMHLRQKDGVSLFYYKQLESLFANPLFNDALLESEAEIIGKSNSSKSKHYKGQDVLCDGQGGLLDTIFRPVITDATIADTAQIQALCTYLKEAIAMLAGRLLAAKKNTFELDFAKDYYCALENLAKYNLKVLPATFLRLLSAMVGRSAVPFSGEPLEGLQIMGPLETRALDFDNVIILSCNEGIFPRRNVGDSFIPSEIRKGFDLPTYEYQDSLWAYYFYRLIQRAKKLWLLVDTGTGNKLKSTEESRYIKQLELHFKAPVTRYIAKATIKFSTPETEIKKTDAHVDKIKAKDLSASAIQDYLKCPLSFYYSRVEELKEPDETVDSLDAGMIGKVLHETMQAIYNTADGNVSKAFILQLKKDKSYEQTVEDKILEILGCMELTGRNLFYKHQICSYVNQILSTDLDYLKKHKANSFKILGLEYKLRGSINGFNFIGFADRMDSFAPRVLRIVDYKTGKVNDEDIKITDAAKVVNKLFDKETAQSDKATIALQLYIYDTLSDRAFPDYTQKEQVIYQTANIFKTGANEADYAPEFNDEMEQALNTCLNEIADTSIPWKQTTVESNCTYCNFKSICGK